jgi:hypothetical protein
MKSFKNKLVVAMAAAMTITMLSATNASAAATALTVGGSSVTTGTTSANPAVLPVPSDNKVDSADALKIAITGLDTGTSVTAVATNATIVTALHTDTVPVTASAGSSTVSIATGTGTSAEFYVYTKTTTAGTVVVSYAGNSTTYYVKGSAGAAYNLSLTAPDTLNISTASKVYVKETDIFGNAVTTSIPSVTAINGTVGTVSVSDTATGTFAFDLTAPATVGTVGLSVSITATDVSGLAAAAKTVSKFLTATNSAEALASANAQIATLTAQLAAEKTARATEKAASDSATVTAAANLATANATIASVKKSFNDLIAKWNKAFPKKKVSLVK